MTHEKEQQTATRCTTISATTLRSFSGTSQYHRLHIAFGFSVILTDGTEFLRKNAHCDWLLCDIGCHLLANPKLIKLRRDPSGLLWELEVNQSKMTARLSCIERFDSETGKKVVVDFQDYPLTDVDQYVDIEKIELLSSPYVTAERVNTWVIYLPSED